MPDSLEVKAVRAMLQQRPFGSAEYFKALSGENKMSLEAFPLPTNIRSKRLEKDFSPENPVGRHKRRKGTRAALYFMSNITRRPADSDNVDRSPPEMFSSASILKFQLSGCGGLAGEPLANTGVNAAAALWNQNGCTARDADIYGSSDSFTKAH
ncbi:Hypothetical protein NTJ_12473 [Nesidiocoris tenuis]|uniref:Uncharacterized protein n=1 Tax=Nesidiocoris tenuis TaxID=355587 RepID=A0ABN7B5H1_9HEMI|nr:Hypothetical protein NTJ_12473 [Nesidiocoris tenuis]